MGLQHELQRRLSGARQLNSRRALVLCVGAPRHKPESLELLNFAGNGWRVNAEPFGQFAYAKGRFSVGVKFVQQRRSGSVESNARFLEQMFVSSRLVE